MKLKVVTDKIKVVPSFCEEAEDKLTLVFRQPTQMDIADWASVAGVKAMVEAMDAIFEGFEGSLWLEKDDGTEHEVKTLKELFEYNGEHITSIMTCVVEKFVELRNKAFGIEKK